MVNMAKIAWEFNISTDAAGSTLDAAVDTGYPDGFVSGPNPFTPSFRVRSSNHRAVIEEDYEKAKKFFAKYED